jgi:uncharacterized membrane protein YfcA
MSFETWVLAAALSPVVVIGTLLGDRLARWLSEAWFRTAVLAVSFLSGAWAVWSSF